jgi:hypothetical protein
MSPRTVAILTAVLIVLTTVVGAVAWYLGKP